MKKNALLAGVSALALIVAGCGTDRTNDNQIDDNTTEVVVVDEADNADVVANDNVG